MLGMHSCRALKKILGVRSDAQQPLEGRLHQYRLNVERNVRGVRVGGVEFFHGVDKWVVGIRWQVQQDRCQLMIEFDTRAGVDVQWAMEREAIRISVVRRATVPAPDVISESVSASCLVLLHDHGVCVVAAIAHVTEQPPIR
jgi:hypothetical protein